MAARLKVILQIKTSQLSVAAVQEGSILGPLFLPYLFRQIILTEPVQDKMFLKHAKRFVFTSQWLSWWIGMVEESKF